MHTGTSSAFRSSSWALSCGRVIGSFAMSADVAVFETANRNDALITRGRGYDPRVVTPEIPGDDLGEDRWWEVLGELR